MIRAEKCYVGVCDNCGGNFDDGQFGLFADISQVNEGMDNCDWYADGSDPDHKGKHYCTECFKYDLEVDDKIIVDLTRRNPTPGELGTNQNKNAES